MLYHRSSSLNVRTLANETFLQCLLWGCEHRKEGEHVDTT